MEPNNSGCIATIMMDNVISKRKPCATCISLKVKCDHTRPCERCRRKNVECTDVVRKPRQKKLKLSKAQTIIFQHHTLDTPLSPQKVSPSSSPLSPSLSLSPVSSPSSPSSPLVSSSSTSSVSSSISSPLHVNSSDSPFSSPSSSTNATNTTNTTNTTTTTTTTTENFSPFYEQISPSHMSSPPSLSIPTTSAEEWTFEDNTKNTINTKKIKNKKNMNKISNTSNANNINNINNINNNNNIIYNEISPSSSPIIDSPQQCISPPSFVFSSSSSPSSSSSSSSTSFSSSSSFSNISPLSNLLLSSPSSSSSAVDAFDLLSPEHIFATNSLAIPDPMKQLVLNFLTTMSARLISTGTCPNQVFKDILQLRDFAKTLMHYMCTYRPKEVHIPKGVAIVNSQFQYTEVNECFSNYTGFSKEAFRSGNVKSFFLPFMKNVVIRDFNYLIRAGVREFRRYMVFPHAKGGVIYGLGEFQHMGQYTIFSILTVYPEQPSCIKMAFDHYLGISNANKQTYNPCEYPYCHCKLLHLPLEHNEEFVNYPLN